MNEIPNPTIDYWMQIILRYTKNSYSPTNTSGWSYRVDTVDHRLYEKQNITDFNFGVVAAYSAATNYKCGEYARSTLNIYESLENSNLNNALTDTKYWNLIRVLSTESEQIWYPVCGTSLEKARIIKIEKSNVYDILQLIAEKFQVQISFEYTYDSFYRITGRTVVIKQEIAENAAFSLNYNVNLKSISRIVDSTDFITKMYVEGIDSEFDDDGKLMISQAPQNLMKENFIYNFKYFREIGVITQAQYDSYIDLQEAVREKNILYLPLSYEYFNKSNLYEKLVTDYTFLNYQLESADQLAGQLLLETQTKTTGIVTETSSFIVKPLDSKYYVDISSKKGAIPGTFTFYQLDGVTVISDPYTVEYHFEDPNSVVGFYFDANPCIPSTTGTLKITLSYNSVEHLNKLWLKQQGIMESLESKMNEIYAQTNEIDGTIYLELLSLETSINTNLSEKQALIDAFEQSLFFAIKEGYWQDSDYITKRNTKSYTSTTTPNTTLTLTPTSGTYFILTDDLIDDGTDVVDLTSLHLWVKNGSTYLYEYFLNSDYSLSYGDSGGTYGLVFVPVATGAFYYNKLAGTENSTLLVDVTTLELKYTLLDATKKTKSLTKGTYNKYLRTYTINEVNVFPSSLSIITGQDLINGVLTDRVPLVNNTDYYYEIFSGYSTITFNTTQNALHLLAYYSISFDINTTIHFIYSDAEETLKKSSVPDITYNIDMVDLSSLPGYESMIPEIGTQVLINDPDLNLNKIKGYISEITYHLDNPEDSQITITNYENIGEIYNL